MHHSGKDPDRGARGSSALLGAVDTMIRVTREEDEVSVAVEKQKDDDEAKPIALQIERVDLSHGLTIEHSLVLVPRGDAAAPAPMPTAGAKHAAEDHEQILQEIAGIVRHGGRLILHHLAKALGWTAGRSYERLNDAVPLAPNGVDVTWHGSPVRLWRTRSGNGSKSPVEVVCVER